jgi:hypothetical protein
MPASGRTLEAGDGGAAPLSQRHRGRTDAARGTSLRAAMSRGVASGASLG